MLCNNCSRCLCSPYRGHKLPILRKQAINKQTTKQKQKPILQNSSVTPRLPLGLLPLGLRKTTGSPSITPQLKAISLVICGHGYSLIHLPSPQRCCLSTEVLPRYFLDVDLVPWLLFSTFLLYAACCPCHWWRLFTIKSPPPWNPWLSPWVHISPKTQDALWWEQLGPSYSEFLSKDIALKSYWFFSW